MISSSCIYSGWVMHRRLAPRRHRFRYRAWWLLLDIDELPALSRRLRLFSHNRFNVFAFHDSDYAQGASDLRAQIQQRLRRAGFDLESGPIRLLAMPRLLGYAFNPLTVFFCHRPDGTLAALIYEVHNTFGERHSYVVAAEPGAILRQASEKRFYVSPFMEADLNYRFRVSVPAETVGIGIAGVNAQGGVMQAVLRGVRRPLDDRQLLILLLSQPLLTFKVIGAIHWEALRLWRKGLRLFARQPVAEHQATIGHSRKQARTRRA